VLVNNEYAYCEADVSTRITEEPGGSDGGIGGLLFWSADLNDYFLFTVNPVAGTYAVFQEDMDHRLDGILKAPLGQCGWRRSQCRTSSPTM